MAKKSASKKKKKTSKATPSRKKTAKKVAARKKVTKKSTAKKTTRHKVAKKTAAKKTTNKKVPKKAPSKKPAAKKPTSKKAASKPPASKKTSSKNDTKPAKTAETKADDKKSGRKGITIVSDKPARRSKPAASKAAKFPPPGPRLLGPGSKLRKPLIPSGPSAREAATEEAAPSRRKKTPFTKKQLDKYKEILIIKRNELIGDVTQMESDALRSNSGGLSNTPQHLAEQGSDSADQSLNLNLAAADRRLIKEIDAALARIVDRTYGLCELTNEPISVDRLEELPWARYSVEAARQLELRGGIR